MAAGRYPADSAEDEGVVAALVDVLGHDEFDRLVEEGRAMTLDDAISLALGEPAATSGARSDVPAGPLDASP